MPSQRTTEDYKRFESWLLSLLLCLQVHDKNALNTLGTWLSEKDDEFIFFDRKKGCMVDGIPLYHVLAREPDEALYVQVAFLVAKCTFLGIESLDTIDYQGKRRAVSVSRLCKIVGINPWGTVSPEITGVAMKWFQRLNGCSDGTLMTLNYQRKKAEKFDEQLLLVHQGLPEEDKHLIAPALSYHESLPVSLNQRVFFALAHMDSRVTRAFELLAKQNRHKVLTLRKALTRAAKEHAIDWDAEKIGEKTVAEVSKDVHDFDKKRHDARPREGNLLVWPFKLLAHHVRYAIASYQKGIGRSRQALNVYKDHHKAYEALSAQLSEVDGLTEASKSTGQAAIPVPALEDNAREHALPESMDALMLALDQLPFHEQLFLLERYLSSLQVQATDEVADEATGEAAAHPQHGFDGAAGENVLLRLLVKFPGYFTSHYPASMRVIYAKASRCLQKVCSESTYRLWCSFISDVASLDDMSKKDALRISIKPANGRDRRPFSAQCFSEVMRHPEAQYSTPLRNGFSEAMQTITAFMNERKDKSKKNQTQLIEALQEKWKEFETSYKAIRSQCAELLYKEGDISEGVRQLLSQHAQETKAAANELFRALKIEEESGDLGNMRIVECFFGFIKSKRIAWERDLSYLFKEEKPIALAYHKKASAAIELLASFSKNISEHPKSYRRCCEKARKRLEKAFNSLDADLQRRHPELYAGITRAHEEYRDCLDYFDKRRQFDRDHTPMLAELIFKGGHAEKEVQQKFYEQQKASLTYLPARLMHQFNLSDPVKQQVEKQLEQLEAYVEEKQGQQQSEQSEVNREGRGEVPLGDQHPPSTDEHALVVSANSPVRDMTNHATRGELRQEWEEVKGECDSIIRRMYERVSISGGSDLPDIIDDVGVLRTNFDALNTKLRKFKQFLKRCHPDKMPYEEMKGDRDAMTQDVLVYFDKVNQLVEKAKIRHEELKNDSSMKELVELVQEINFLEEKSRKQNEELLSLKERVAAVEQACGIEAIGQTHGRQDDDNDDDENKHDEDDQGHKDDQNDAMRIRQENVLVARQVGLEEQCSEGSETEDEPDDEDLDEVHAVMQDVLTAVTAFENQSTRNNVTDFYKFSASSRVTEPLPPANSQLDSAP